MQEPVRKLASLMKRGRDLHFENLKKGVRLQLKIKIPPRLPPELELVYGAVQLIMAHAFMSNRQYLSPAETDSFIDELAEVMSGANQERFIRLVQIYSRLFDHEEQFRSTFAKDVSQILTNAQDANLIALLTQTPRSVLKTTHLYCAMIFGDEEVVSRLS